MTRKKQENPKKRIESKGIKFFNYYKRLSNCGVSQRDAVLKEKTSTSFSGLFFLIFIFKVSVCKCYNIMPYSTYTFFVKKNFFKLLNRY